MNSTNNRNIVQTTTSLTTPDDREQGAAPSVYKDIVLTPEEVVVAKDELILPAKHFPRIDRAYGDTIYKEQIFCVHSFVPSKGAIPDKNGLFGFMKCRGTFATEEEAKLRCENIIRTFDSAHSMQTSYVGRPFPIAANIKNYIKETDEVKMQRNTVEVLSEQIRESKRNEDEIKRQIQERERKLLEESLDDYKADPVEEYTTLKTKLAQLSWTYWNNMRRLTEEVKPAILRTREQIAALDAEDPSLKEQHFEVYSRAARAVGLDQSSLSLEDNFTRFLVEDIDIGF